jgi:Transposase, Mutator family
LSSAAGLEVLHLRWPSEHRKRIRSTNLLERTFVEAAAAPRSSVASPGETSALSLIWAVLELSSHGWRGVVMTPRSVAEIERLRRRQRTTSTEEVIARLASTTSGSCARTFTHGPSLALGARSRTVAAALACHGRAR